MNKKQTPFGFGTNLADFARESDDCHQQKLLGDCCCAVPKNVWICRPERMSFFYWSVGFIWAYFHMHVLYVCVCMCVYICMHIYISCIEWANKTNLLPAIIRNRGSEWVVCDFTTTGQWTTWKVARRLSDILFHWDYDEYIDVNRIKQYKTSHLTWQSIVNETTLSVKYLIMIHS